MAVKRNVGNLIDETYIFGQKVPKQYGTTKAKFSVENISPVTMLIRCRQINASTVWHQESKVFS